jgi:acetylornithine deacetylase
MTKQDKYIALLKQMLAIPSVSREENTRADFLFNWLKGEGLTVSRKKNNLVITGGNDPSKATFLLNSHIDTVPPGDGWDNDPYIPKLKGGIITGLGSNDAGGSVVALTATYMKMVEMGIHEECVLVLSAEEELGGENGISLVLPDLKSLRFAIVGEPTGMRPAVAERGLMVIDATATGKAGHAARNEGTNAIYNAIRDIQRIQDISFFDHSQWLEDPSVNVTMIEAGKRHNMIPAKCEFVIDVRSNDKYSNERLLDILGALCKSELKPRSMRLRSSALPEGHPVHNIIAETGLEPFGSPTLSDISLNPVPSVKLGPGDSARSHTANEYILESEITESIHVYTNLIQQIIKLEL